jgi:hypothetical protein
VSPETSRSAAFGVSERKVTFSSTELLDSGSSEELLATSLELDAGVSELLDLSSFVLELELSSFAEELELAELLESFFSELLEPSFTLELDSSSFVLELDAAFSELLDLSFCELLDFAFSELELLASSESLLSISSSRHSSLSRQSTLAPELLSSPQALMKNANDTAVSSVSIFLFIVYPFWLYAITLS